MGNSGENFTSGTLTFYLFERMVQNVGKIESVDVVSFEIWSCEAPRMEIFHSQDYVCYCSAQFFHLSN